MNARILLLAPALLLAACSQDTELAESTHGGADQPAIAANDAETVGTAPSGAAVLPVAEAVRRADELAGQTVAVEGTVAEVCQMAGCWLTFQNEAGQPFRVAVPKDDAGEYTFTFPKDVSGARVTVAGTLEVEQTDVETLRHFAEDEGKSEAEIAAITAPERTLVLHATGARIDRTPVENV